MISSSLFAASLFANMLQYKYKPAEIYLNQISLSVFCIEFSWLLLSITIMHATENILIFSFDEIGIAQTASDQYDDGDKIVVDCIWSQRQHDG